MTAQEKVELCEEGEERMISIKEREPDLERN
jgi:hypothetical protein